MAPNFSWQDYMTAWNTANVDKILSFYAEDCEVVGGPQPVRGKPALRKSLEGMTRAFSEMNGDAEVLVAAGEYVAALLTITSVHTGPLDVGGKSIPATNKRVEQKMASFLQLDNQGKIKKEWDVADQLAMFQQLGVQPPAMPAGASQAGTPQRR